MKATKIIATLALSALLLSPTSVFAISVSTPKVSVSAPKVSVSTPKVTTSTPKVSAPTTTAKPSATTTTSKPSTSQPSATTSQPSTNQTNTTTNKPTTEQSTTTTTTKPTNNNSGSSKTNTTYSSGSRYNHFSTPNYYSNGYRIDPTTGLVWLWIATSNNDNNQQNGSYQPVVDETTGKQVCADKNRAQAYIGKPYAENN